MVRLAVLVRLATDRGGCARLHAIVLLKVFRLPADNGATYVC